MHRPALALAVALGLPLLSVLGACSDPAAPAAPEPEPDLVRYVALGDSYAAAPGVPETSGEDGCFRSSNNYPHLVAAGRDDVELVDVSCSGATTGDLLDTQLPSVDDDTDLVTLGIGGNDYDLFGGVLFSCLSGVPCGSTAEAKVDQLMPKIERNIGRVLDEVAEEAPDAQVIVVGYPDLVPDEGTCPQLPLAPVDYPLVDGATVKLNATLERQATERGLTFLDLYAAGQGHDICSADPWVNGSEMAPEGAIPYHPFGTEQEAVAELVLAAADSAAFR